MDTWESSVCTLWVQHTTVALNLCPTNAKWPHLSKNTKYFFFSTLVHLCRLCECIFICPMGSRWRGWQMWLFPVSGSVFSIWWVRGLRRLWSSSATFKHEAVPTLHVIWTWMRHRVSTGRTRTIYHSKFIKWPSHSEEKDQRRDNISEVFKRLI